MRETVEAFEIAKQGNYMMTSDDSKARELLMPGSYMPSNYCSHI